MASFRIDFRVEDKLVKRLDKLIKATGHTRSHFMREALKGYLNGYEGAILAAAKLEKTMINKKINRG